MSCAALLALPGAPFLSHPAAAAAQEPARGAGAGFTWESTPGLAATARRFEGEMAQLLAEARAWTKLPPDPRPVHLRWVATREELAAALGGPVPEWYAAVAEPAERRMIIATEPAGSVERLRTTLRHEVLHLAMADMGPAAFERLPAWFHEGCAEAFAGDVYLGSVGVSLPWRSFVGELEPLSDFDEGFGRETYKAAVGYALGYAFVARLIRVYGPDVVPRLLARAVGGENLDQALVAETTWSIVTHEEALRASLASPMALLGDVYPDLFLVMALLLIVAFPLVRAARRRRRREFEGRWEREDRRERLDAAMASGQWREPLAPSGLAPEEEEPLDWLDEEER